MLKHLSPAPKHILLLLFSNLWYILNVKNKPGKWKTCQRRKGGRKPHFVCLAQRRSSRMMQASTVQQFCPLLCKGNVMMISMYNKVMEQLSSLGDKQSSEGAARNRGANRRRKGICTPLRCKLIPLRWEYKQGEGREEKEETDKWREEKMKGEDRRWCAGWVDQSVNIHTAILS